METSTARFLDATESGRRHKRFLLAALLVLAVEALWLTSCGRAGEGWRKLSENEVRELFAGSTVEGYHELNHYSFRSYYQPSGAFRSEQGEPKKIREGQWRTTKSGDICVRWQDEARDLCRAMVVDQAGQYRKVKEGLLGTTVVVTFKRFAKENRYGL